MTTPDHRLALPPGTRVQDFEFHRVLGHGGFGITYLGWNVALDIAVAIKEYLPADLAMREQDMSVLPKSSGDEADFQWGLDRFLDEARVMARFKHPNIVQVQHFFQAHGTAYIVMEYVEGETLSDLLKRRGALTEGELQGILLPLLAGLIDVHEAGILHRDIKPGNILLRAADTSPVLVDFGAARQAVGARSHSVTAVLTPGYAPIEQYSSRGHQGPWTDIYAMGGVCYQALTGKVPDEAMDRIRQDPMAPIRRAAQGKATEVFLSAIDWSLRVEEADRPQGIRVWRAALLGEEKVPALVTASSQPPPESLPGEKPKTSRWLPALGLILVIGAGAWWGIQEYPGLFGQGAVDTPEVSVQETPEDMPGETPQEVETGETGETLAGVEQPPSPEVGQPATAPVKTPPTDESEVTRLLAAAEADLKARRLTRPVGNNAWGRYLRVLELEPANPDAIRGMDRVIESYGGLFDAALEQEDFDKAAGYLASIRDLNPNSLTLEEGEQQLIEARQARAARLAEQERRRQAEEAARQAELERQRIAQAIEKHWQEFETAIGEENLSEATGILVQISDLNPEEPGLAEGEQRLIELEQRRTEQTIKEHWVAFEAALEAEDLSEAAGILSLIREMNPEVPGMVEGEQRLAEAQQTALEREFAGEMVSIPGGTFRMGDLSGEGYDDERPVHTVTLPAFRIGKYELTFTQWDACVADGGCGGYRPDDEGWGRGSRPVINVSWDDVQLFIDWLNDKTGGNFRLPTEAEWEYAARAGSTTKYHFGNAESQLCRYANHADDSTDYSNRNKTCSDGVGERTSAVGRYQLNSYGLYDMHGNVWELVQDCWNDSYVEAPSDGRAWTSGDCGQRVRRGGSWYNPPDGLSSSIRGASDRWDNEANAQGFRLAQDK